MDEAAAATLVEWREWGAEALDAADARACPVLLSVTAPWCTHCREMDEETYAEPRVAAHLSDGFVPVRVDADRQPRVRERYNVGGFPVTAFLTPDGEVLTAAGYLGLEGFRGILDSVRRTWDARGTTAGTVPRALGDEPPAGEVTSQVEAHMIDRVTGGFDEEFGGWGEGAKFPLPHAVEFAAKRERTRDHATRTLEAIHAHLLDTYDGGFYRYADSRDWSGLHREKLTDENAALVRAFATGYLYTGEETYREAAEATVDYLTRDLWTDTGERGAFAGSQAGGDYYTLSASEREDADPPHVDPTVFADRNGLAADALLRFHAVTDHHPAARHAERALDTVLDELVDDGEVTHFPPAAADEGEAVESGLLVDGARLLTGLTTAAQVLGDDRWLAAAREVADRTLDLRDGTGAFRDGPDEGPGLLARSLRPLDTNVEVADALIDLAVLTGDGAYREAAADALAAFAGAAGRMGVEVAGYATACARQVNDPLVVETPPADSDLHRAALRLADHEKVVVPGERDPAVARRGETTTDPASGPEELAEAVAGLD
ncbi:thioredoxin domain-containing protein [Halobacteriales archaeon QS_4_70_19]|nr:MAG: thioredoxin domain-containing protein [Halobacteriales archaeon QS_4_70_19]